MCEKPGAKSVVEKFSELFKTNIISYTINLYLVLYKMIQKWTRSVTWFKNHSHEKMREGDMTPAQLVLCSTALVLRQDSGVR